MIIVSGVAPGSSGVGRLMAQLVAEQQEYGLAGVRFLTGGSGVGLGRSLRAGDLRAVVKDTWRMARGYAALVRGLPSVASTDPLVLVHPQGLTRPWVRALMRRRRAPVVIYVMDCSFFCIRSYNHVPGECGPCLRCLGARFGAARDQGCRPFPPLSFGLRGLLQDLKVWTEAGRVVFLAQTESQIELLKQQFGENVRAKVLGLWTVDFPLVGAIPADAQRQASEYDVVFHGSADSAKGFEWGLDVARRLPEYRFLFPTRCPAGMDRSAGNIAFKPMRWETGLEAAVRDAQLVLNPSLWSAPIEGALVKSIVYARRTAVVDIPTSWVGELPADLVLRLPSSSSAAADVIRHYLSNPRPTADRLKRDWYERFCVRNKRVLLRLCDAVRD